MNGTEKERKGSTKTDLNKKYSYNFQTNAQFSGAIVA